MPTTLFNVGDALRGDRIVIIARRVSRPMVVNHSGRHNANKVIARDDVHCVIQVPLQHRPRNYRANP